jgi:hypothetical protein
MNMQSFHAQHDHGVPTALALHVAEFNKQIVTNVYYTRAVFHPAIPLLVLSQLAPL